MFRAVAIALLLFSAADLATPFLIPSADSLLPACCRRDGKHHCAMMDMLGDDGSPKAASPRCPLYQKHGITANIGTLAGFVPAYSAIGLVVAHSAPRAVRPELYRSPYYRSQTERGPPVLS